MRHSNHSTVETGEAPWFCCCGDSNHEPTQSLRRPLDLRSGSAAVKTLIKSPYSLSGDPWTMAAPASQAVASPPPPRVIFCPAPQLHSRVPKLSHPFVSSAEALPAALSHFTCQNPNLSDLHGLAWSPSPPSLLYHLLSECPFPFSLGPCIFLTLTSCVNHIKHAS